MNYENNLNQFDKGTGTQITGQKDPELVYHLSEAEIAFYSYEPDMSDIVHPFRPSGDFVIEAILEPGVAYFTGDLKDFDSLDDELRKKVEKSGPEYYKEFKSPV